MQAIAKAETDTKEWAGWINMQTQKSNENLIEQDKFRPLYEECAEVLKENVKDFKKEK